MVKKKKELLKLQKSKGAVPFQKLEKLLKAYGYEYTRSRGSHFRFKKKEAPSLTIPVHNNKVKNIYLKEILKAINNENTV